MDDPTPPREGSYAGLLAIAVLAISAFVGWRFYSERNASTIDTGGFDISAAPQSRPAPPAETSAPSAPAAPASGLDFMKVDEEIRGGPPRPRPEAAASGTASAPAPARTLAQTRQEFTALARRHENVVRRFAERMTAQSPVIMQYGKDWMSHPDLKNLTIGYWRTRDPIAFMAGLSRSPSFPLLVKQYAGQADIRTFIVVGLTKEAPHDLVSVGLDLMRDDPSLKATITQVGMGVGLPPGLAAALGARDPKKPVPPATK
jgi:hypothetical protein